MKGPQHRESDEKTKRLFFDLCTYVTGQQPEVFMGMDVERKDIGKLNFGVVQG